MFIIHLSHFFKEILVRFPLFLSDGFSDYFICCKRPSYSISMRTLFISPTRCRTTETTFTKVSRQRDTAALVEDRRPGVAGNPDRATASSSRNPGCPSVRPRALLYAAQISSYLAGLAGFTSRSATETSRSEHASTYRSAYRSARESPCLRPLQRRSTRG